MKDAADGLIEAVNGLLQVVHLVLEFVDNCSQRNRALQIIQMSLNGFVTELLKIRVFELDGLDIFQSFELSLEEEYGEALKRVVREAGIRLFGHVCWIACV